MKFVVDALTSKLIDAYAIEEIGIPAMVLMERAAMAVASVVMQNIDKRDKVLTICGTGNNGGDGIAVARLLVSQGYQVDILILGNEERTSEQTNQQISIAKKLKMKIFNNVDIREYNIIIDAIFGVGLTRDVDGIYEKMIETVNDSDKKVFSVDLPSGINASNGEVMNIAIRADYTITFSMNKVGLVLYPGCGYAGNVIVADIGIPDIAYEQVKPKTFCYEKEDMLRLPVRNNYSNKGSFGKVLIIAGSQNMSGACFLSAKAAYRTGAGIVKIVTVDNNRVIMQSQLPEAILSTYEPKNIKNKHEIDQFVRDIKWASSIVIGPGMGANLETNEILHIVLNAATVPVIIDADAINVMESSEMQAMAKNGNIILTPHLKEMSGLLGCTIEEITKDNIIFAEKIASDYNIVLALKDARTVVTDGCKNYVNISGNHGMATAGSGDVLTGIIAALLAQGMNRFDATALGVYVHGLAGDFVAKEKNGYALMASDMIEALSQVLRK